MSTTSKTAYWNSLSDEWKASGETQKNFCKRKGISYGQFVACRTRLLTTQGKSRKQLREVSVIKEVALPKTAGVQLSLPNGVKLNIISGASLETISHVLNSLGVTSC